MSHQAPFVVHYRLTPKRGKRFETIRDLQRIARRLYTIVAGLSGVTAAIPGGGQAALLDTLQNSDYVEGMAVKPQFGETPAQMMLAGFYTVSTNNVQPHTDLKVIAANAVQTGAFGAHPWTSDGNPVASITTEVKALKALLDGAVTTLNEPLAYISLFRLDYKGIIWGDRGYTFPR